MAGVGYRYGKEGDAYALKNVDLEIEQGSYVCLLGRNGSGKSTLARLFNALITADEGSVEISGVNASDKSKLFDVRRNVGMVFQNPDNQMVASIVEDDLAFGAENLGVPSEEIGERITAALQAVEMTEFRKATPSRLSGGQKQRIAIAGALVMKPKMLVLDEATAMLDPKGRREIISIVKKLNKEDNMTVVAITHYMEEALDADEVVVLDGGTVAVVGSPNSVLSDERKLKSLGLALPRPAQLAVELKKRGVDVGLPLSREQLKEALCAYFQRG